MTADSPPRAALIYARVSTEEQGRGYSLPTQIEAAEKRAAEQGYTIAGVFTDKHTGTEIERPGLSALYDAIARTGAQVVLCHAIDRIGRDVIVNSVIERLIASAGARVEYLIGNYAPTPEGDLSKTIQAAIGAYENSQRLERSRRGKNGRAQGGSVIIPAGRAPYGYTYVPRKRGGDLVIDEQQAAIVRQIYAWLTVNRLSSYEIARRLYADGVPSKGDLSLVVYKKSGRADWSPTSVRKLVTNPVYKGTWYWGKTRTEKRLEPATGEARRVQVAQAPEDWIGVTVPAIIGAETWERAQDCLRENKRMARRNAKRDYLLQGRIFCTCGRRFVGRYKNHLCRAYYRCPTSEQEAWRKACPTRFGYRQEAIEASVWRYVIGELLNPEHLAAELERQREAAAAETERRAGRLQAIEAEVQAVDHKLEILIGQALDGLPQSLIDGHKRTLLGQRQDLQEQRARCIAEGERVGISEETVETLHSLAAMVQEAEPYLTPTERRHMLDVLRLRVEVIDQGRVRVSGLITGAIVDLSCSLRQ